VADGSLAKAAYAASADAQSIYGGQPALRAALAFDDSTPVTFVGKTSPQSQTGGSGGSGSSSSSGGVTFNPKYIIAVAAGLAALSLASFLYGRYRAYKRRQLVNHAAAEGAGQQRPVRANLPVAHVLQQPGNAYYPPPTAGGGARQAPLYLRTTPPLPSAYTPVPVQFTYAQPRSGASV
jgi:hypothetical protein